MPILVIWRLRPGHSAGEIPARIRSFHLMALSIPHTISPRWACDQRKEPLLLEYLPGARYLQALSTSCPYLIPYIISTLMKRNQDEMGLRDDTNLAEVA